MSEFHLETARFPPAVYVSHEQYEDGGYLQGASIPGLAWISAGRTREVAWSYTYAHGDCIDLLVERCREGRYQAGESWVPVRRREELARVKGQRDPERWVFGDQEHGTILGDPEEAGDYLGLRWSGFDRVGRDIDVCLRIPDCRTADELAEHHRGMRALSAEGVFADARGNVASAQCGQVEQRCDGWRGVLPRRGWDLESRVSEPLPEEFRAVQVDPPGGQVVSANAMIEPPRGSPWCSSPQSGARRQRLADLLARHTALAPEQLTEASYDQCDLVAARLLGVWSRWLPADDPRASELVRWGRQGADSASSSGRRQLALFWALHQELACEVLARRIGAADADRLLNEFSLSFFCQHHLDRAFALERPELLDEAELAQALGVAWQRAPGRIRRGEVTAPVATCFDNFILKGRLARALGFGRARVELPGGPSAPFQTRVVRLGGEKLVAGPAFHLLFDMARPGGAYNIAGGASERRFGPGYGRGVDAWLGGHLAPLGTADPVEHPRPAVGRVAASPSSDPRAADG